MLMHTTVLATGDLDRVEDWALDRINTRDTISLSILAIPLTTSLEL